MTGVNSNVLSCDNVVNQIIWNNKNIVVDKREEILTHVNEVDKVALYSVVTMIKVPFSKNTSLLTELLKLVTSKLLHKKFTTTAHRKMNNKYPEPTVD